MSSKPVVLTVIALLVAWFAPGPVGATPPRAIAVEDNLFGVSENHLFLLRSVRDNLETHGTTLTDILLVAKSFDTGQEENAWPVRRIQATGDPFASRAPEKVRDHALADRVNPFDILTAHNGRPLTDNAARSPADALLQQWSTEKSHSIGRWTNKPDYEIGRQALAEQLGASLATVRRVLPAYQDGYDPLLKAEFPKRKDCQAGKLYFAPLSDRLAAFIRLDCFDAGEQVNISIYVSVPVSEMD